jgi:hypothetical protein
MLAEHGLLPTFIASINPFEESILELADAMELSAARAVYVAAGC